MDFKNYAPVLITTLNRYEHFKRCLESLENCSGADKTEVFVALDYPPSEKYFDGWKKNDAYLLNKEKDNGFKRLHVMRRNHNYGVCHKNDNFLTLLQETSPYYESYIATEDDNEFSPNFLEYVNWGLNEFKEDNSIYAICGCKDIYTDDINNNVYKLNTIFCAWGYGSWYKKNEKWLDFQDFDYFRRIINNATIKVVFSEKVLLLSSLISQLARKSFHGDVLVSLLDENEKWCVFPKVNKVRNWGWDGTGTHGGSIDVFKKYSTLPMDMDEHFEPVIFDDLFNPIVFERFKKKYKTSKKTYIRAVITYLCYKLTGYIPVANKKSQWCKVKLQKVQ